MNSNYISICYQTEEDKKNILEAFNKLKNEYCFKNNCIEYFSIFSNKKINDNVCFEKINLSSVFYENIKNVIFSSLEDIKEYYKIVKKEDFIIDELGIDEIIKDFKNDLDNNVGLFNSLINILWTKHEIFLSNKIINFIFKIIIFNDLLIYFGYFLKWNYQFENSYIGFWSHLFSMILDNSNPSEKIKEKMFQSILKHLFICNLNPIFYDDGSDNLDSSRNNNIFIYIKFSDSTIDFNKLNSLYEEKNRKIDRVLQTICKDIEKI